MENIIYDVAIELVNCFDESSPLVFPKYYNNSKDKIRISEQESKILFASFFIRNNIKFSVEVPTKSKHIQSGATPISARFDLVTYKNNDEFDWVIELKSKIPPIIHFTKDFEKMALSDSNCIWFHTLKNSNEETYKALLEKINEGISSTVNKFVGTHIWKIAIMVIEKKELYIKEIELQKNKSFERFNSINDFEKKIVMK